MRVTHILYLSETTGRHPFGGVENHLMALLPALRREGVDVELIAMVGVAGPTIVSRLRELESEGVTVTTLGKTTARQWRWLFLRRLPWLNDLRILLTRRRNRVIHVHLDPVGTVLTAWLARCPLVVLGIHNDEPFWREAYWRLWLRCLDSMVSHYVAISNRVRDYYVSVSGISPGKIATVYYGLEALPVGPSRAQIREAYQIPRDAYVVGFLGRLTRQKNLPVLIEAIERLPDVQGVVVGGGEVESELRSKVNEKGMGNIRFLGPQTNGAAILPMFDVLCLPSRWEGLGLVLIEAMLSRVPVIGSRAGAIPEILGGGEYGMLFDADDVSDLVKTIVQARQEPQLLREMAERAFQYAQRTFCVDTMARSTLQVYTKVQGAEG